LPVTVSQMLVGFLAFSRTKSFPSTRFHSLTLPTRSPVATNSPEGERALDLNQSTQSGSAEGAPP